MVIAGDGCIPDYLPEGYPRQGKLELPNPNYLPTADSRWKGRAADLSTENELHPGAGRVPMFAVLLCQMDFRGSGSRLPTERGEERNHLSKKTEHPTRGSTVWLTHNGFAIRSALTLSRDSPRGGADGGAEAYALGNRQVTRTPPVGPGPTESSPPKTSARWRMMRRPLPPSRSGFRSASNPRPLSSIAKIPPWPS